MLVVSGTQDEYYGGESQVYKKRNAITNPRCAFILMDQERHNGHFDYMLSDRALEYQALCRAQNTAPADKWLAAEQDDGFFDRINTFFLSALE